MSNRPVHIGCSGWNYADWRGAVYPPGCPPRRWLAHYATLFGTVEVNSTFYRLARPEAVARWVADTPPGFVFTVKSSRYLTHVRRLQDMERGVERLYAGIAPLVESGKLGPVLWQLPANFHRDDDRLAGALERLPPGRHCFEFRHPSWFCSEVYGLLHTFGVALVEADDPRRPLPAPAADRRLRLHPLPPRPSRPARELLRERAARVGGAAPRTARGGRGVRVLQQRLGGVRGPQRAAICAASWRLERPDAVATLVGRDAGWSSQVARRAHNPKVAGSNPAPAISRRPCTAGPFLVLGRVLSRGVPFRVEGRPHPDGALCRP